jgi:hypothetical protein
MCLLMRWELTQGCQLQSIVATLMQLCINIKDNYSGKNEMFFDIHVEMAFALALIIQFNIWTL